MSHAALLNVAMLTSSPPIPVCTLRPRISAASTTDTVLACGNVVAPLADSQAPLDQGKVAVSDTVCRPRATGRGKSRAVCSTAFGSWEIAQVLPPFAPYGAAPKVAVDAATFAPTSICCMSRHYMCNLGPTTGA